MSIDARVNHVIRRHDGSGEIHLIDRPARPGEDPGICGRSILRFDSSPHDVVALTGQDVWGGASTLMLGDRKIARRVGYSTIVFTVETLVP